MSDVIIMLVISIICLSIAYYLYIRKEIGGQNLNIKSGNGSGEGLYGKKDVRQDGSYTATKWFMILLIPIIPLGTYRVLKGKTSHNLVSAPGIGIQQSTEIRMERLKMDWHQVITTYAITLAILILIALLIYYVFN